MSKINLSELSVSGATEEQYISVSVLDLKSPQTIIAIFAILDRFKKLDITRGELCRQCIGVRNIKICVPAGNALFDISCVVRYGIHTNVFQNDHRRTSLDNAEEDVVITGPLKRDVEPEAVAIKRQRRRDILYDEEWRNAGNFCFSHVNFPFLNLVNAK